MRIIICDDDKKIPVQLKEILQSFFNTYSLKQPEIVLYYSGEELLSDKGEKDIIFLDIEMPGSNGIFVGNKLKKENDRVIIFTLSFCTEYLDDAMRFNVFRYLIKPLDKNRIFKNMKDALKIYNTKYLKIPIEMRDSISTVLMSEIIFIEIISHTTIVHTINKDYISIRNMQYWLKILDFPCFFSPHRSFLVNFEYVCDFDHTSIHLYNNQYTAYLTRRKYTEFKNDYFLYLESIR